MTVLEAGGLEEADGGQVAGGEGGVEVVDVVLVVGGAGAGIGLGADGRDRRRGGCGSGSGCWRSTGRARGAGCSRLSVTPVTAEVVVRLQPVVPLELVTPRSKPPWNQPQLTLAALSRSPMFLPDMLKLAGWWCRCRRPGRRRRCRCSRRCRRRRCRRQRRCSVDDAVGLAGDQVDGALGGGAEGGAEGVVVERVVLGVVPHAGDGVAVEVAHGEGGGVGGGGALVLAAKESFRRCPGRRRRAGRGPSCRRQRPTARDRRRGPDPRWRPARCRGGRGWRPGSVRVVRIGSCCWCSGWGWRSGGWDWRCSCWGSGCWRRR